MELVDGDDLSQRIARGAIPIDDALPIAKQIAEALEAAHEQGIIHRDLKPANIKVRSDGTVKVLDFGLAKAMEPAAGSSPSMSMSPTITTPAMTQAGMILGTAAYMSPEQARGRKVDKRADVWAFGCVLFEMLTGTRAFGGEDATETIAAVVKGEPPLNLLPVEVHAAVRELLRGCLVKDPQKRIGDMAAARFVLDHQSALTPQSVSHVPSRQWQRYAMYATVSVLILAVRYIAWSRSSRAPAFPEWLNQSAQFSVDLPEKERLASVAYPVALSSDGRHLVFVARGADGKTNLWLRELDAVGAHMLAGTEDGLAPFWSPDSQSIGFFVRGTLKRIAATGGPVRTVIDNVSGGGTWNKDDIIVVSRGQSSTTDQLVQVPASGGMPRTLTALDRAHKETIHLWPQFLSDGRHFVFQVAGLDDAGVYVSSLDTPTERRRLIAMDATSQMSTLVFASGYLFFVRDGVLMAQTLDEKALTLTGDAIRLADGVQAVGAGRSAFSASQNGVLVYWTGVLGNVTQATWMGRDGKALGALGASGAYGTLTFSPDGSAIALMRLDSKGVPGLWLMDATRGTQTKFPFQGYVQAPVWSPDGARIAFSSGNPPHIYIKASSGSGAEEQLFPFGVQTDAQSWSPDGTLLVYSQRSTGNINTDLWMVTLKGEQKRTPLLQSDANENGGRISPDGKWLAYQSNESGRNEVYVTSFPQPARKIQISTSGGTAPRWNKNGRELFFESLDRKLMAVTMSTSPTADVGTPRALFETAGLGYDVAPDGQRFLVLMPAADANPPPLTVVLNWPALARQH